MLFGSTQGIFTIANGVFTGFTNDTSWTFTTKAKAPAG